MIEAENIRRKAKVALILRARLPRDGDGDGFYDPNGPRFPPGDVVPVPPKVAAHSPSRTMRRMPDTVREVVSTGRRPLGDPDTVAHIGEILGDPYGDLSEAGLEHIGSGSHRQVWLDPREGVVYKIGLDAANREEARVLARLRREGADYAPDVTLYEVDVVEADLFGDGPEARTQTVIAMPYLPEDGSVPHEGLLLPAAGDLNPDNVVSHGGRLWLIDAGGM